MPSLTRRRRKTKGGGVCRFDDLAIKRRKFFGAGAARASMRQIAKRQRRPLGGLPTSSLLRSALRPQGSPFFPFFRASERPIAMACFRLFTVPPLPPLPLLDLPP